MSGRRPRALFAALAIPVLGILAGTGTVGGTRAIGGTRAPESPSPPPSPTSVSTEVRDSQRSSLRSTPAIGGTRASESPSSSPSPPPSSPISFGLVSVDPVRRVVTIPARINQTNGIVEYALVTEYGKTHESLLVTDAAPRDVHAALLLLNARPSGTNGIATGTAASSSTTPVPPASAVSLHLRWPTNHPTVLLPLAQAIGLTKHSSSAGRAAPDSLSITGRLPPGPWLFNGSYFSAEGFAAHFEGSIIALIRDPASVLNNPGADQDDDDIHVPGPGLPPYGTPVLLELTVPRHAESH